MTRLPLHFPATRFAATLALATLIVACATPGPPPVDESQLLAAGFKVVPAKTTQQFEHLESLPAGKLTGWQRTGKHFFLYPDVAKRQLYVGTPKEYLAYLRLVPGAGPTLEQQQASNMADYAKQDAAMQMYTTRDLNDPYYFWGFDGLGWP
jgi:hypothetical protein